jgi:AraC family transcriptional regulator
MPAASGSQLDPPAFESLPVAGRIGASLITLRHGPGEQVDAPEPVLTIGLSHTPAFGFDIDSAGQRHTGRMLRHQLFLVPPNVGTRLLLDDAHHLDLLSISYPGLLSATQEEAGLPADGDFHRLHPQPFRHAELLRLVRRLRQEGQAGMPHGSLYAEGLLLQVSAILLRLRGSGRAQVTPRALSPWRMRRVIDYLNSHLSEDVSISTLAAEAGLSPFHFARAFRDTTGLPPYAYVRSLRTQRVRELLGSTRLSIAEIASRVGYATPQALTRMFRAETGMTPTEFRASLRG